MQHLFVGDYPPIPECFSHLLRGGLDEHLSGSQQDLDANNMGHHEPTEASAYTKSNGRKAELTAEQMNTTTDSAIELDFAQQEESMQNSTLQGSFQKLNSSLGKLHREMKDLRNLDISLFHQLVSLSEAIQDLKMSGSLDRFSETGSEYSLGTGSHMGSMSSLNDWSTEDEGEGESVTSTLFFSCQSHTEPAAGAEIDQNSTSQLLMQIRNLALKADQDF